jgi:hypothetical protein
LIHLGNRKPFSCFFNQRPSVTSPGAPNNLTGQVEKLEKSGKRMQKIGLSGSGEMGFALRYANFMG